MDGWWLSRCRAEGNSGHSSKGVARTVPTRRCRPGLAAHPCHASSPHTSLCHPALPAVVCATLTARLCVSANTHKVSYELANSAMVCSTSRSSSCSVLWSDWTMVVELAVVSRFFGCVRRSAGNEADRSPLLQLPLHSLTQHKEHTNKQHNLHTQQAAASSNEHACWHS